MLYTTLFFDLDDTLYPSTSGLWDAIKVRISQYMIEQIHIPESEVPSLRNHYYNTYGTTLRGLQRHHGVDADQFLAYVHDLPLKQYIRPDSRLRQVLTSLPQLKFIFTNADANHANRVLAELELTGCFDGIIDVRRAQWACKPEPSAYRLAMEIAGEPKPHNCVLFDDSARNLEPARLMGFTTVLVGSHEPIESVHKWVRSLIILPEEMPELWRE